MQTRNPERGEQDRIGTFYLMFRSHLLATKRNLQVRRPNVVLTYLGSPKQKTAVDGKGSKKSLAVGGFFMIF